MKAATYDAPGEPDVLIYEDVPDPPCARDEVLIKAEAISIEGGDLINRASTRPPNPKHILGYAAAGEIVAVGADVRDRFIGQKVTSFDMSGSHAELRAVKATRTWIVPEGLDMAAAAALQVREGIASALSSRCALALQPPAVTKTALLADTHLVLEIQHDALVRVGRRGLVQRIAEPLFSNAARAFGCTGRVFWCEKPSRRRIRDRLCGATLLPNRPSMKAARSGSVQRDRPSTAASGPLKIRSARSASSPSLRAGRRPGPGRSTRPARPSAL